MYALVTLLYDMAARIQDIVGLTFGNILALDIKQGKRVLDLPHKKTESRPVLITQRSYDAVQDFKNEQKNATDDTVMFPPGQDSKRPTSKWCKRIKYFFEPYKLKVQSRNFRSTFATNLYKSSGNDMKIVQNYMAHSKITTTETDIDKVLEEVSKVK